MREVPAFEAVVFKPRASRFCLCLPVLNENGRLHEQLRRTSAFLNQLDIVIADGGSTDGSVAQDRLQALGVRALLIKKGPGRLGAQLRLAFAWSLDEGYDGVITMDGNNKDDPAAIPSFIQTLENGTDHIQGSRFIKGGRAIHTPLLRWLGVRLLHAPLISWAAHYRYTDTTNGFRGYSRRLLEDPRLALFRHILSGYELHYYVAIRAARLNFHIAELPVTRAYPPGKTPTKIHGWRGNLEILKTLCKAVLGYYDPR